MLGLSIRRGAVYKNSWASMGWKCLLAGFLQWFIVGYYRWYPMRFVNLTSIVLAVCGIILLLIGFIAKMKRMRGMSLKEAKKYLKAFAKQYDACFNADIQELLTAICVMDKAGLLKVEQKDSTKKGTVVVDEDFTEVQAVTHSDSTRTVKDIVEKQSSTKPTKRTQIQVNNDNNGNNGTNGTNDNKPVLETINKTDSDNSIAMPINAPKTTKNGNKSGKVKAINKIPKDTELQQDMTNADTSGSFAQNAIDMQNTATNDSPSNCVVTIESTNQADSTSAPNNSATDFVSLGIEEPEEVQQEEIKIEQPMQLSRPTMRPVKRKS